MTNGTEKKGLSPIAWIAIGCGALLVLGGIAVAALVGFGIFKAKEFAAEMEANPARTTAEMVVKLNPDLDLVETDDEAGTITFRNNKTGEVATMNFQDIADGKFSVTTDEGTFSVDGDAGEGGGVTITGPDGEARFGGSAALENVPDWVPLYPDAAETQGTYNARTSEGLTGIVTATTTDKPQAVLDYYKERLASEGYEITSESSHSTGQGSFANVTGEDASAGRTLNVTIVSDDGETSVAINYTEKAQ